VLINQITIEEGRKSRREGSQGRKGIKEGRKLRREGGQGRNEVKEVTKE
jgi:hypothetical protein